MTEDTAAFRVCAGAYLLSIEEVATEPAGDLDEAKMMRAKSRLEKRGYRVKMRDDLFTQDGYLAGSDERRADELMEAFLDPEVKAIFPGTGGYGRMRILDLLDYKKIRKNPKIVIGFSDITGLHLALNGKAGLITYHTPSPMWGLGRQEGFSPFTKRYFFAAREAPYRIDRMLRQLLLAGKLQRLQGRCWGSLRATSREKISPLKTPVFQWTE